MPAIHNNLSNMSSTIFIGDIPSFCSSADIVKEFLPFGEISDVRITTSPKVGQNMHYGFVEFKSVEPAQKALTSLNGKHLCGVPMRYFLLLFQWCKILQLILFISSDYPLQRSANCLQHHLSFPEMHTAPFMLRLHFSMPQHSSLMRFSTRCSFLSEEPSMWRSSSKPSSASNLDTASSTSTPRATL